MELLLDPERYSSSLNQVLGPVQTSCFCRAERLNLGIKLDKSTAEAQCLNKTFALSSASSFKSSTRSGVLHDSGKTAIETTFFCRAKLNS